MKQAAKPNPTPPATPQPPAVFTGLPHIEHALPEGARRVLYYHEPTVDAAPFLLHGLRAWLADGGRALHATTSRSAVSIETEALRLGIPDAQFRQHVRIIDLREAADLAGVEHALEEAQKRDPQAGLVIETLTGLLHKLGERRVREWFPKFVQAWGERPLWVQLADRAYEPGTWETLVDPETTVRIVRRDLGGARQDCFVPPSRGGRPRHYPYRVDRPGGIRVHIPKILVTGAHNAGKSSFVHTVAAAGISVEHSGTTVALDHGTVERDGITVDIFGTPGQERFDLIIGNVAHGALGVIVVVDSTRPSTFHRARELAERTSGRVLPVVWAANKQDAAGAAKPEEIRSALKLGPDVPVLACVATNRDDTGRVLDALIERVLEWAPPKTG